MQRHIPPLAHVPPVQIPGNLAQPHVQQVGTGGEVHHTQTLESEPKGTVSGPPPQLYQPEFQQEVAKKLQQQQQQQLEQQQQQQKFLEHQQQQKLIEHQQQQKLLEQQQQQQKLVEQQQKLIEQQQQQQKLLEQQKAQQQSQNMDQVQYQQQPDHIVYQQPDQAQFQKQHQSFKIHNVQNVDIQQYHQAQSQNAQAVSLQYQNSVDQGKLSAAVQYQNVEQSQLQYQQSVEQPPLQYQQSSQAHVINQQQSADQGPIVYQQAVDPAKIHYQSADQPQVIYQAVEPGGVQQLQYPNGSNVPVQQYQQQPHQQQAPESIQNHLQHPGVGQQQTPQVLTGGVQPAHQPVIQPLPQHLQQPPAQQQQQYHQQQLHLVPLQQVPEAMHGLSCIQQVQPVHEMIKEEQTGQLVHMMGGVGVHEARVLESEELARAVEEKPLSQVMPEPVHPMVKKIQEIQSMPPQGMPASHNTEAGYETSQTMVDPKNLAVDVPSMPSGGSYLSPGSVGASGTSGYNSQQSTVTSDIGVSSDPISTIAGQERDKVSCVSSDFDPLCSACPPTAPRPSLKLDTVVSKVGVTLDDPHYPTHTHTVPGWVTAPIIFTPDLDGVAGRESRRGSLPVAQPGTASLLYPPPPVLSKPHSADTSPNPKCLSASSYSNLSLKLPFPSQSLRRRSADPSDLYRSRQTHHRHISGSTSPTSEELLALPLLEQRRASGGSALLSPLWEQLP